MAYVDPSSSSTLVRLLAPIFILVSVFWVQFRHRITALVHRLLHRPGSAG